jgi:hypothetical protein
MVLTKEANFCLVLKDTVEYRAKGGNRRTRIRLNPLSIQNYQT